MCGLCAVRWPDTAPPVLITAQYVPHPLEGHPFLEVQTMTRPGALAALGSDDEKARLDATGLSPRYPPKRPPLETTRENLRKKRQAGQPSGRGELTFMDDRIRNDENGFIGQLTVACRRCGWRHAIGAKSLRAAIAAQPERLYSSRLGLRRAA